MYLKRPDLDLKDSKVRAQLRRNIGRWLRSDGVPERRGDPLIPIKDIPEFKAIALRIIQNLESRSLEDFRHRILPHLKRIREENGLKFSNNMLKKHKWSKFLQEHQDIKNFWDRLPKVKSKKRQLERRYKEIANNRTSDLDSISSVDKNNLMILEKSEKYELLNEKKEEEFENININITAITPEYTTQEALSYSLSLFVQPSSYAFINQEEYEDITGGILREWKERTFRFTNFLA